MTTECPTRAENPDVFQVEGRAPEEREKSAGNKDEGSIDLRAFVLVLAPRSTLPL